MGIAQIGILTVFDIVIMIILTKKLLNVERLDRLKVILITISLVIVSMMARYFLYSYSLILGIPAYVIAIYFLYKRSLRDTICSCFFSYIAMMVLEFLGISIVKYGVGTVGFDFKTGIISQSLGLVLATLLYLTIPLNIIIEHIKRKKIHSYILANTALVLMSFALYWNLNIQGFLKDIIILSTLSLGIVFLNFILLRREIRSELERQKLNEYDNYFSIINELIEDIRSKQHEFDNHIQAIRMIRFTNKNYESLTNEMDSYMGEIEESNDLGDLIKLNNKILAGFLYKNKKMAKTLGIEFEIIVEDYNFRTALKNYELIELTGNLVKNAFETGISDNHILFSLKENAIEVKNKHSYIDDSHIEKIFEVGYSTKAKSGRGYGMKNIVQILDRYSGEIEVYNEMLFDENYFVVKLLF
ncbi:sensor histidine kinase CitA [Andreesenia angusta]|uniref:Sensor histidine kinase CitA n=1 Tax=Andreesenia angusta TaxID=39480 RepID=A0A1S1V6Y9_9FIRM|nr:ATP-binding protein [Andreesenia angusta]OHW62378.1 sensor histidine kinase CitA [Andreesenia angusta]